MSPPTRRPRPRFTVVRLMLLVALCAVGLAVIRVYPVLLVGLAAFVAVSGLPLYASLQRRAGRPLGVVGGIVAGALMLVLACGLLMVGVFLVFPDLLFHIVLARGLLPAAIVGAIYGTIVEGLGGWFARRDALTRACRYEPRADPALKPYLEGPSVPLDDPPA